MKSIKSLCIIIILLSFSLNGNNDLNIEEIKEFADHLFSEEDYLRSAIEYERYLYYSEEQADTVLFKLGLSHQMRDKYNYAARSFKKLMNDESSRLKDQARLAYLYNLYRAEAWDSLKQIKYRNKEEFFFYYSAFREDTNGSSLKLEQTGLTAKELDKYQSIEKQKNKLKKKNPLFAGFLSAILPGLGRWYTDKRGDAVYSFTMTGLSGLVSYLAFGKDLIITGVVGSGITITFYLGSIYGSYIGARIHNQNLYAKIYKKLEKLNPVEQDPYWEKWIEE